MGSHKNSTSTIFFAKTNNKYGQFTINTNKTDGIDLTLHTYILEIVNIINNSKGKVQSYECIKLEFEKRDAYYLRFDTINDNIPLNYFIFITENNDLIYDYTLKGSINLKNDFTKELFGATVYSLCINDKMIFEVDDEIISSEPLRIEEFKN